MTERAKKSRFNLRLRDDQIERLAEEARRTDVPAAQIIRSLVDRHLQEVGDARPFEGAANVAKRST